MKVSILLCFTMIFIIILIILYELLTKFLIVDENEKYERDQCEFIVLIDELENLERKYSKYISDGLLFDDYSKTYSLDWYDKFDDLYWNFEKDSLYTLYKNETFPVREFSCKNIIICNVGPFIFDLENHSMKNIYISIIERYIYIFNKRIDFIIN